MELIAEIGDAHGGDVETAVRLCESAHWAGFDTVKGQIGISELTAPTHTLHARFADLELSLDEWGHVADVCTRLGLRFSASVWSPRAVGWLAARQNVPWIKVGSGDAVYTPTLDAVAGLGIPVYLSVGMCTEDEILASMARLGGSLDCLLLCTVAYPAETKHAHLCRLRRLAHLHSRVGFSSHFGDWRVPLYATQLGAQVIEVHFRGDEETGRDHERLSLSAMDAARLCGAVKYERNDELPTRFTWECLGSPSELGMLECCESEWYGVARRNEATGLRE